MGLVWLQQCSTVPSCSQQGPDRYDDSKPPIGDSPQEEEYICVYDQIKYNFFGTRKNWTILPSWLVIRMGNPDRQKIKQKIMTLRFWIIVDYENLDRSTLDIIMVPEWIFYDLSFLHYRGLRNPN